MDDVPEWFNDLLDLYMDEDQRALLWVAVRDKFVYDIGSSTWGQAKRAPDRMVGVDEYSWMQGVQAGIEFSISIIEDGVQ